MSMTILYTKLGWKCNSDCIFCAVGDFLGPKDISMPHVIKQLELGRNHNATLFSISGGEPTARNDLPQIIEEARKLGYDEVHIQTNGRALCSEKYCNRLISAGATKFIVSIHGHTAFLHDKLTQARGGFLQTSQGIRNIVKIGNSRLLKTNTTVVIDNFRYLSDIVLYLENLGVLNITISYVQPSGRAKYAIFDLAPRMSEVADQIRRIYDRPNLLATVVVDGIPPCLLGEYKEKVRSQLYTPAKLLEEIDEWKVYCVMTSYMVDSNNKVINYPSVLKILSPESPIEEEEEIEQLFYASECACCECKSRCPGIWNYYVKKFGFEELQPMICGNDRIADNTKLDQLEKNYQ